VPRFSRTSFSRYWREAAQYVEANWSVVTVATMVERGFLLIAPMEFTYHGRVWFSALTNEQVENHAKAYASPRGRVERVRLQRTTGR
jgi:hypothetical protein